MQQPTRTPDARLTRGTEAPINPPAKAKPDINEQYFAKTNERILALEKDMSSLKDALTTINGTLQGIAVRLSKMQSDGSAIASEIDVRKGPENGLIKSPEGNVKFKNEWDPLAMVEIAIIPYEGYTPALMQFPDPADKSGMHLLTYNFRTDESGNIHYFMPRMFAAAQLRTKGGVKTVLVFPDELPITVKGPKLTKQTVVVKADKDIKPIFER